MIRTLILVFIVFACASNAHAKQTQNLYTNEMRSQEAANAFYMDRYGDLYPPAEVPLNTFYMLNVKRGPRAPQALDSPDWASLKGVYRWKSTLDPSSVEGREWAALLVHTRVSQAGEFESQWRKIQAALRRDLAARISDLGKTRDVVLLIHGYNNSHFAARKWYIKAEEKLAQGAERAERKTVFVRMYWDGLEGKTPFVVWTKAQYNGYLVGVELRTILNQVAGPTPMRVFTHSSGAFVITNALGDASVSATKMPTDYYPRARGTITGYAPPVQLSNLHVAMLIPAQPVTAFASYFRDKQPDGAWRWNSTKQAAVPKRLILGLSNHDFAAGKSVFPCRTLGDSCMAVKVERSCHQVAYDLRIARDRLRMVHFVQPVIHAHAVEKYADDPEWSDLVASLFDTDAAEPLGSLAYCPAPLPVSG